MNSTIDEGKQNDPDSKLCIEEIIQLIMQNLTSSVESHHELIVNLIVQLLEQQAEIKELMFRVNILEEKLKRHDH